MRDNRNQKRRNSPHRVNVLGAADNRVVGRLVNITIGGLMYLVAEPPSKGTRLELSIPLPTMANGKMTIEVTGTVAWSAPDANPEFQRVGVEFENLGAEEGYIIETVLQRLHLVG